jgi:hypothetical protein
MFGLAGFTELYQRSHWLYPPMLPPVLLTLGVAHKASI